MRNFLSTVLASTLGTFIALFLIFLFFSVILAGLFSGLGEKESIRIHDPAVLQITVNGPIPDQGSDEPKLVFSGNDFDLREEMGLRHLLKSIEVAAGDEKIKGIYLKLGIIAPGAATLEELRHALAGFKKSGKFIVAYGEMMAEGNYYLATVADLVAMQPGGIFEFNGLASEQVFFKDALDKLGVKVQVFYVGRYKSATEPFRYDRMSDANREQTRALLNSRKNHQLSAIAAARNMPVPSLEEMQDRLSVFSSDDAYRKGLVDTLVYLDEVYKILKSNAGIDPESDEEKIQILPLMSYYDKLKSDGRIFQGGRDTVIAVVYAEGEIVSGKGGDGQIGSDSYIKTLRNLRNNDKVGGVVLRINSPGGSALASDAIGREVKLLNAEKPVVVSMGNLAASGGYYISAPARYVYAQSNTITGSIGIFGMWLNMGRLLSEKLGITSDTVKTADYADVGNIFRPLSPREMEVVQRYVNEGYRQFLHIVAEGRQMDTLEVHEIAQGRVWSGEDALKAGLVDGIGGIKDAIAKTAELAGIKEYRTEIYPRETRWIDKLSDMFGTEASAASFLNSEAMKPLREMILSARQATQSNEHLYYRMPYNLIVH